MGGIFLSYRRSDSTGWAGRLHDTLQRELPGRRIFMDVEEIPPGVKFADYIHEAVGSCDVLIALIGPHWLDARDDAGQRRLDNPADFTRLEIMAALERDVRVIPTLVGDARMPTADTLPPALRGLCDRQNFEIHDRAWDDSCKRLCRALQAGADGAPAPGARSAMPPAPPRAAARPWAVGGAALLVAVAGLALWSPWSASPGPSSRSSATGTTTTAAQPGRAAADTAQADEQARWDSLQANGKPADFARHLARYPAGAHAALARSRAGNWLATRSGCLVEDPSPDPASSHTWSGGCRDGLADGSGVLEEFKDGKSQATLQATMQDGRPVGPVHVVTPQMQYQGELENGKMSGRGVVTMADGSRLEGNFVAGELSGRAVMVSTDGARYEGEVRGLKPHGQGTLSNANEQYVGGFVNGKREGQGSLVGKTGIRYEGGFIAGKPSGPGVLTVPNGNRLIGNFVNGQPDGRVTLTTPQGQRIQKSYAQGKEVAAR